jgi:AraC-like DNA-binding protein
LWRRFRSKVKAIVSAIDVETACHILPRNIRENAEVQGQTGRATGTRSLSDLLAEIELSGRSWCYCDLGAQGGYSLPPAEAAYFHAVLHGSVRIASPSGGLIELQAGEAVAVISGEAHALRISSDSAAPTLDFLREERRGDIPPTFQLGQPGAVVARVLSGRLGITLPSGAARQALPAFVLLGDAGTTAWGDLLRAEALPLAGIGPGSTALLTRVAALMIVAQLRADPDCRQMFSPERQDPIGQALRLIAGNPSANWSVERLARSVGMGRSNFAAHFSAQVGRAPMEVVAEQRMEQAAQLLRKGSLKIAEISELCGYGSEAAFSRRFTRHFGVSPSQMRETARASSPSDDPSQSWLPLLSGHRMKDVASQIRQRAPKPSGSAPNGVPPGTLSTVILRSRGD